MHCMCLIHQIMPRTLSKIQHMNEISKLMFLTYFQSTFSQRDQLANFAKYIESRFKKKIDTTFESLKKFNISHLMPSVVQKDNLISITYFLIYLLEILVSLHSKTIFLAYFSMLWLYKEYRMQICVFIFHRRF